MTFTHKVACFRVFWSVYVLGYQNCLVESVVLFEFTSLLPPSSSHQDATVGSSRCDTIHQCFIPVPELSFSSAPLRGGKKRRVQELDYQCL